MRRFKLNRRQAVKAGGAAAVAAALGLPRPTRAQAADRKFLFVIAANGGGSILDSLLPINEADSPNGQTITAYPSFFMTQPSNSTFKCVHSDFPIDLGGGLSLQPGRMKGFLERHAEDTAVMTLEGTSVNHLVAAKRAMNGAGANRGRTITEDVALRHGEGMLLANCNMGESGYLEPGEDAAIPGWARAEPIADASLFGVATDGVRGVPNAPERSIAQRARRVREKLDDQSVFAQSFHAAPVLQRYISTRRTVVPSVEAAELITKLMIVPDLPNAIPLSEYGLESSPELDKILSHFPDLLNDPFEAQAALAFVLARYQISCALTISPSFSPLFTDYFENTALAFDFSHSTHVFAQYAMWNRVLDVADHLIQLLKAQPFDDEDEAAGSMWDRSLVYIATEFGRDKVRPEGSFDYGTGHHLNNGAILVSPLLNGNTVYGGVDLNTALTHGFDRTTGEPDLGSVMREQDVYSVIAEAMDISYDGQISIPCILKS